MGSQKSLLLSRKKYNKQFIFFRANLTLERRKIKMIDKNYVYYIVEIKFI